MRGPIPKPQNEVDRKDDPSNRRKPINRKSTGKPTCPKYLDKIAKQEWKHIVPELDSLGLLSKIDRAALEFYCESYSRYRQAMEHIRTEGEVMFSPDKNYPMVSPWASTANKALDNCRRFLAEFGLTPAARARLRVDVANEREQEDIKTFMKVKG